jgi:hypothetical protein
MQQFISQPWRSKILKMEGECRNCLERNTKEERQYLLVGEHVHHMLHYIIIINIIDIYIYIYIYIYIAKYRMPMHMKAYWPKSRIKK